MPLFPSSSDFILNCGFQPNDHPNTMQAKDKTVIKNLIDEHVSSNNADVYPRNDSVTVQFHDLPENFGVILQRLTKLSYSYYVQGGWEVPPRVDITHRDYYEDPHN